MLNSKTTLFVSLVLISTSAAAQAPAGDMPPRFTVDPVAQTASWAVEWWMPRHAEKIELAKEAQVDLLFVGDSITHAWETDGAEVWQEYYERRNGFNLGFSGDRTEHVLWRLDNGALDNMQPKLIVLMIGTNNTGHRMDPAAYTAAGIERIVGVLRSKLPTADLLILGIFPRHISPYNQMRVRNDEINTLISALDDGDKVHYLDISEGFLNEDGTLRGELMPDLLHPNAAGYRVWAESTEPTIERLLQD